MGHGSHESDIFSVKQFVKKGHVITSISMRAARGHAHVMPLSNGEKKLVGKKVIHVEQNTPNNSLTAIISTYSMV